MITSEGWFGIDILSDGVALLEQLHEGKVSVTGSKGQVFGIALMNLTNRPANAVIAVNGLCAVEGRAYRAPRYGLGYILKPRVEVVIDCWRFPTGECEAFQFGMLPAQFAQAMDKPTSEGEIQVTFFFEQRKPTYLSPNWFGQWGYELQRTNHVGWGNESKVKVWQTQFARETTPATLLTLNYQLREELAGVS